MKRTLALLLVVALTMLAASPAAADEGIAAQLNSYEETPATLNSDATGVFLGLIPSTEDSIAYQLFYNGLTSNVLFAHIHFGKPGESGGIVAFLCGGGGKPACPATTAFLTGTIVAADVQAVASQHLAAGDIIAFIRAIKSGFTYANVHTTSFPTGELRGQIKSAAR
jgi:CHRD domain